MTSPLTPRVNNIETGGAWKIGDVKQSFLDTADFQAEHDNTWVLCDGTTNIVGSDLHALTGLTLAPDLRGRFLRGASDDSSLDPDGPRAPGSTQAHLTSSNGLSVNNGGAHTHNIEGDNNVVINGQVSSGHTRPRNGEGVIDSLWMSPIGSTHSHGISGGVETRPHNTAVRMYIKVNREPTP